MADLLARSCQPTVVGRIHTMLRHSTAATTIATAARRPLATASTSSAVLSTRTVSTKRVGNVNGLLPNVEPATRMNLRDFPVVIGPRQMNRNQEFYRSSLCSDLLYMTYDPELNLKAATSSPWDQIVKTASRDRGWDPSSPYSIHRSKRPPRGMRDAPPSSKPFDGDSTMDSLPRLERIVLTSFSRDAIGNKNALVPLLAQFQAITGLSVRGSYSDPAAALIHAASPRSCSNRGFVEIIRARAGAASFKLRPGMPVGVKAVLPGPIAHDFLETLVTFVLPRLRSFSGFTLPAASQPLQSPAANSGVVSLGMIPDAIPLFPQIEVNQDQYPNRPLGFQIDCITNLRGKRATENARILLSGLGVPFIRRGDR